MSKSAIILLLISASAVLWQQSNAKPFLFLPANFFVLTTQAPTAASQSTYSSKSTIQLPLIDVNAKVGLLSSLLNAFTSFKQVKLGAFGSAPTTTTTTTSSPIEVNTDFTPSETTKKKHKHSKHSKTTATPVSTVDVTSENGDTENSELASESTNENGDFVSKTNTEEQVSGVESEKPAAGYKTDIPIKGSAELSEGIQASVQVEVRGSHAGTADSINEILGADVIKTYLPPSY